METFWKSGRRDEVAASWSVAPVGGRLLHLYAYASTESPDALDWVNQFTERWVTSTIAVNEKERITTGEAYSELKLAWWTALIATMLGWLFHRITQWKNRLAPS